MSNEEALRAVQERDAALMAEAAAAAAIPPVPDYQPPLPPSTSPSGQRLVEQQIDEEDNAPERTLRTTITAPNSGSPGASKSGHGPNAPAAERRETTVLPVLEEAVEGTPTGDRSRNSRVSSLLTESDRPLTPAKDGYDREPGFGNPLLGGRTRSGSRGSSGKARPPPTPPKTGHGYGGQGKAESADSGYGVLTSSSSNGGLKSLTGSQKSLNIRPQISRDSLDKALPPLPNAGPSRSQGVS
jgi:1-phosphatidylinositol-4-phosphate 5-kinase